MRYIRLYENFKDFEEVWEEEPDLEIDLTGVQLGRRGPDFNILDKVICINQTDGNYKVIDSYGYIIDYNTVNYLVYFINNVNGHGGRANIPKGHAWWVPAINLRKV